MQRGSRSNTGQHSRTPAQSNIQYAMQTGRASSQAHSQNNSLVQSRYQAPHEEPQVQQPQPASTALAQYHLQAENRYKAMHEQVDVVGRELTTKYEAQAKVLSAFMVKPGLQRVFLPNRFSHWSIPWLVWHQRQIPGCMVFSGNDWPFEEGTNPDITNLHPFGFPFPDPPAGGHYQRLQRGETNPVLPQILLNKMYQTPLHTTPSSRSDTSQSVTNLDETNQHLHSIQSSKVLWDNLVKYTICPEDDARGLPPNHTLHTFRHGPPVASRRDQVSAIYSLHGWYTTHLNLPNPSVNCEFAVQDEIRKQLLDPQDYLLQARYANTIYNQDIPLNNWEERPVNSFMPAWSRPISANHADPTQGKHKAGYPDFLLHFSPQYMHQSAIVEVKTWWAFTRDDLKQALSKMVYDYDGKVKWEGSSSAHKLMRQIWGEVKYFGVRWGVWTNGKQMVAFVNTSMEGKNELTFGDIRELEADPTILQGITGLSFASIDERVTGNYLVDLICPPGSRTNLPEYSA